MKPTAYPNSGGNTTRQDCGATMRVRTSQREKFIASAASHCGVGTASIPARAISAAKAAAESTTVTSAMVKSEACAPESWKAKKMHISFTRKGILRNTST